ELTAKGAYVRDIKEVERELARTQESIALAEGKTAPAPKATTAAPASASAESLPDPIGPLLALAADALVLDVPSAAALVKDRAIQYLSAFTDRRITGLEIDAQGKAQALTAQGKVAIVDLP